MPFRQPEEVAHVSAPLFLGNETVRREKVNGHLQLDDNLPDPGIAITDRHLNDFEILEWPWGWGKARFPPPFRFVSQPSAGNLQSVFTSRICSTVSHFASRRR